MERLNLKRFYMQPKNLIALLLLIFVTATSAAPSHNTPPVVTTQVDAGNIRATSNTISTTNSNGNLTFDLNGTGSLILTDLTASTVPYLDSSKKITSSAVTPTELGRLTGLTSTAVGISDSQTLTNKTIDASSNTISNIVNANISAAAAITRTKLANGTASHVLINDGSGIISSEATLSKSRGGAGADMSSVTFPASGVIVTEAGTQTLTNKTLTAPTIDIATLDGQGSTPANPSSGFYKLYFKDSDGKPYYLNSAGSEVQVGAGGAGVPNYITNYNIETDTTGFAVYGDAAGVRPVNGTGGSPTVSIARSTSSPLRDIAHLNFVKDANNRQGEGFSYDFTINRADRFRKLAITFDYRITSGTYASGDLVVEVYDVTNGVLLEAPDANSILNTGLDSQPQPITFQTTDSQSYRLIFHVASTSASAYTLSFDNFVVGPQNTARGPPVTNWVAYTPTVTGFGTATSVSGFWRRVGSNIEIKGKFTAGTTTAVEARASLPTGVTSADTVLIPSIQAIGHASTTDSASTIFNTAVLIEPSVTYVTFGWRTSTSNDLTKVLGNAWLASGRTISFYGELPVAGWVSNTEMSADSTSRTVSFQAYKNGGSAFSADTAIPTWSSARKDSVSGFNATTGVYTVKVAGDYFATWMYRQTSAAAGSAGIYVTSASGNYTRYGTSNSSTDSKIVTTLLQNLKVGDTVFVSASVGATLSSSDDLNHWSMFLISGNQQISATERISFLATTSTTAATTSAPFIYTVKVNDTHNAYSTSTGKFTAPAGGFYQCTWSVYGGATSFLPVLYVNTVSSYAGVQGVAGSAPSNGAIGLPLNTGDVLEIRPNVNTTASGGSGSNWFSCVRAGGL